MIPTQQSIRQFLDNGLPLEDVKFIEENLRKNFPDKWIGSVVTEMWLDKFLTQDPEMLMLKEHVRILARYDDPVIIYGETGTGKEILANALHASRTGKFEALNCAAIPEQLLESILFGHKKGSFTDAKEDNPGLMRSCWNGTLFLDEIGEMPASLQGKLLRCLQPDDRGKRYVRAIGANDSCEINCRMVFATNQNLLQMCEEKRFRTDLYYRINVFELRTKPLGERGEDVYLIAKSLWPQFNKEDYPHWIKDTQWRGNVRQLQNIIRRIQVGL